MGALAHGQLETAAIEHFAFKLGCSDALPPIGFHFWEAFYKIARSFSGLFCSITPPKTSQGSVRYDLLSCPAW